ncbi:MAG: SiaB family protein kinase [Formivibrio sp.]|nr:SiaB family protein kinase [Formivibrio sp.]
MQDDKYYEFFDYAHQRDIIFYYVGYFSQNIISAMAETVRLHLEKSGASGATRRKLFSTFVEMAQNIVHYSASSLTAPDQIDEVRHGSVCIGRRENKYFLLCANPVHVGDTDKLRKRLEPLRTMTLDEIKRAYKESLLAESPADSKGADLGFLTVARDASEPIEFEFRSGEPSDMAMFYLKAII